MLAADFECSARPRPILINLTQSPSQGPTTFTIAANFKIIAMIDDQVGSLAHERFLAGQQDLVEPFPTTGRAAPTFERRLESHARRFVCCREASAPD